MSFCGLLRDGHGGGGCWLIVGDGGGGLVDGLSLAMVVLVYCELWWTVAEWVLRWAP